MEIEPALSPPRSPTRAYTGLRALGGDSVPQVGVLIVDNDAASQSALKSVLDSESWRVRIVPDAPQALHELANGAWNLAVVSVAVADLNGPLFAILRELADAADPADASGPESSGRKFRVLFLVPLRLAATTQALLEGEELPYLVQPYHLHDFFEKVSDLLVESGVIEEPIRSIGGRGFKRGPMRKLRAGRHAKRGAMFASREDYQMTEEEMSEYERQEEEDRKKREKERRDREHLG